MIIQDSNSGKREKLGFTEAVAQYITPLLITKGFTCTEQTAYSVRFQSPNVALAVFHDPISYEIDLIYALHVAPLERYNLYDMLDTMLGPAHKGQKFFQASKYERVVFCIKAIADHLKKYGEGILIGEPIVYQRIGEAARHRNEVNTKEVVQHPIRQAAEEAWQNHDYAKVLDLYEPIEADLTLVEKKRLDYARSHSPRG